VCVCVCVCVCVRERERERETCYLCVVHVKVVQLLHHADHVKPR
jgi:hypothetical protein